MTNTEMNPATDNFYVTGGTLRRDAACYVQRRADQALYDSLMQGNICYVLTSRQMGKSSLMVRTAARLREEGVHVAVLDLTSIGQNLSAEQWYDGLLARVGQQFQLEDELEDAWLANTRLSPLLRWMNALRDVVLSRLTGRIVIFVDEIDAVRSLSFSTDEFFAAIRELYNRRTEDAELERLTFCLLGVATPSDLIRDTRTTPFNIGQRIELNDFTDDEAAPLIKGLGREDKTATKLLKRILYWTGGHPYLTQRLCQAVAADTNVHDAGGVDRLCEELFFTTRARERDDNLLFVRERLLKSEADRAALLDLYKKLRENKPVKDDETNPLISVLRLSGITRVVEGLLYVRNRIYYRVFDREWVLANLPDAEVLRQRAAYRRGLWRAAAVAAVIVAALGVLSFVAIRQRNRAVQSEQTNRRLLYTAQMNVAGEDYASGSLERMRQSLNAHVPAAGENDLRDFEWFYLWRLAHREELVIPHSKPVFAAAFSPDGKMIASGDADKLCLWDSITGQQRRAFAGPALIRALAYSPTGKTVAAGYINGVVKIWDVETGLEVRTLEGLKAQVFTAAFSPDGKYLAAAGNDAVIKVWEVETGKATQSLAIQTRMINAVAFSPDGQTLASESDDFTIRLWELKTGRQRLSISEGNYGNTVAFSPDGKYLVSGSLNSPARLWNVSNGQLVRSFKNDGSVLTVAFSPDGKTIAMAGSDPNINMFDTATGNHTRTLKGHTYGAWRIAFSPDGQQIVSAGADKTVRVWRLEREPEPVIEQAHTAAVASVVFSPDGRMFASAGFDSVVHLWDAASQQKLRSLTGHIGPIMATAFSPDGKTLASAGEDKLIKLWDVATGREFLSLPGHQARIFHVIFSPDGKKLFSNDNQGVMKFWDVALGKEITTATGFGLAVAPDGRTLATTSTVGVTEIPDAMFVGLIDVETKKVSLTLRGFDGFLGGFQCLAFSADGRQFAFGSDDSKVTMWDAITGQTLRTFSGHGAMIAAVLFSPNGKRLVTASSDKTIKIWDTATGEDLLTLKGHTKEIYSIAFSPDGQTLISGSADKTIRLWRAAMDADVQARRGQ